MSPLELTTFFSAADGEESVDTTPTDDVGVDTELLASSIPDIAWSGVDKHELMDVKRIKALSDPFVYHDRNRGYAPADGHPLQEVAVAQRLAAVETAPARARLESASLADATLYLASATGDAGACLNQPFVDAYTFAFKRCLQQLGHTDATLPAPLDTTARTPEVESFLADLQADIKASQDQRFLEGHYDELGIETIPKRFWTAARSSVSQSAGPDGSTQESGSGGPAVTTLDEFMG